MRIDAGGSKDASDRAPVTAAESAARAVARRHRRRRAARCWVAALALLVATRAIARADEVVVKGDRLRGTVKSVTASGIELETVYGKGSVQIPFADVEEIRTDGTFVIEHGDGREAQGRIVGIQEGVLLVGDAPGSATRVAVTDIQLTLVDQAAEESPLAALKSRLRYWSGNFDLGLSLAQGTVDSTSFSTALGAERRKSPTRFVFGSGFLYGTQKKRGESQTKLADQLFGELRGEYDLTERIFAYGDGYAEYNAIQRLSIRGIPGAGFGYKIWKPEEKDSKDFLAGTVGGSWVYEKYFGGDDRNYMAIAFGAETHVSLPYNAVFTASAQYLPAVDDFQNDFLIRSQADLSVPVWKQLALKFSVADDYDNTPAEDTSYNYLTMMVGVSAQL